MATGSLDPTNAYHARVAALIEQLGLRERVRWLGFVSDEDAGRLRGAGRVDVAGDEIVGDACGCAVADLDAVLGQQCGRANALDRVVDDVGMRAGVADHDATLLVVVDHIVDDDGTNGRTINATLPRDTFAKLEARGMAWTWGRATRRRPAPA